MTLDDWLHRASWQGITPLNAALALAAALLAYALMSAALGLLRRRLAHIAAQTRTQADDALVEVLHGTSHALLALAALLIGVGLLDLPERWAQRVGQLWFVAVVLQLALWAHRLVGIGLQRYLERNAEGAAVQPSAAATLMSWGARTLLWAVVVLGMLSNLGVNITAFVASLGVGGIAVALAAQNILGDLFASVAIAVDKPFEVGDAIAVGAVSGTVEHVGIKTTRLRSPGGEQIVMSNADLLKQALSNYKRLQARRIVFGFGVAHGTPPDQLAQVPGIVEQAVRAGPKLRFDRAHLKALGPDALDFEVVYTVLDADYGLYMDEQQRIHLTVLRELAARGIALAAPRFMPPGAPHPPAR